MTKDDDKDAFRAAVGPVKPLRYDRATPEREKPAPVARFTRADQLSVLAESLNDPTIWVESGDEVQFCRAGLKSPIMRKLKRGQYSLHEEIDLHGLNASEAKQVVYEFLKEARRRHWNCVRIIHGKGKRSFQGLPVLRPKVIKWLQRTDCVIAFCTATARDGGTGALYVLLD
ncbi:MAG: Smr/MutS family protein [Gammaproteobacteria bacterium]